MIARRWCDRFDARDGIRVLSLLILVMGLAPILAPLAGGQLLVTFGWRSIFWALAGYGTFGLVAVALLLPESLPPDRRRRDSLREVFGVYGALIRDRLHMAHPLGRLDHGRHVRASRPRLSCSSSCSMSPRSGTVCSSGRMRSD
jgi:MFS family permease